MTRLPTRLSGLVLIEPRVFPDSRGWFFESWHADKYAAVGVEEPFVQDNVSWSNPGVLRGLHAQNPQPQGKLVQALVGEIWDVAVDIRRGSPTFGEWEAFALSEENKRQLYVPPGFAHGFLVTRGPALVTYKCTSLYHQPGELTIRFDDQQIAIAWPIDGEVTVSDKDRQGLLLAEVPVERLVVY